MNLIPAPEDWGKSTYSSGEGGNCVEWSSALVESHDVVPVRDSKVADGPVLTLRSGSWRAFVEAL